MLCGFLTGNLLYCTPVKAISTLAKKVSVHKEIKRGSGYHIHPPRIQFKEAVKSKMPYKQRHVYF